MAPPSVDLAKLRDQTEILTLKSGPTVQGVVLDPTGKAVPNLLVKEVHNRYQPNIGVDFKTDENGRFELRNRNRRQIMLIAMPENYALLARIVTIPPEGTNITLQLGPLSPLRVKVVDQKEQPVKDALVALDPIRSKGISFSLQLKTDANGLAVWTNAPVGGFALTTGLPGQASAAKVRVSETTSRDITLKLREGTAKAIVITGNAVDAETGAPVKFSAVRVRKDYGNAISLEPVDDTKFRFEVPSDRFEQGMYASFRVQFEADGYLPFLSEQRDFDEGDWDVQAKMKRGGNPGGTVLLSDGTPATGATVYTSVREHNFLFMNTPGKIDTYEGIRKVSVDDQGGFDLKDPGVDSKVLITHDNGFAETSLEKLRDKPKITLQPWGSLEGVLKKGQNVEKRARVVLSGQNYGSNGGWGFHYNMETDDEGKFSIEKVPPGTHILFRYFDRTPGPITETYQMPVEIKPGEVTKVVYGGTGRVVVGQVEGNADWMNDTHLLVLKQTPAKVKSSRPRHDEFFDPEEYNRLYGGYQQGDAHELRRAARSYWVNFSPDGSFRIDDVPPGTYELRIKVTEPAKPGEQRFGPVGPEKEIAALTREVIVPEAPASGADEPLDLGVLELNWRSTRSTQPAISLTAETLSGKPFSLENERGKFVLLNFWTLWSESSQEQMAEVTALGQQFKDEPRVAFYGVVLGGEPGAVRSRVKANGYAAEQLALSPRQLAEVTQSLSLEALPSAFLLNEKGQVMARDLRGDGVEKAIKRR